MWTVHEKFSFVNEGPQEEVALAIEIPLSAAKVNYRWSVDVTNNYSLINSKLLNSAS